MKRFFCGLLIASMAIGTSPQGVISLSFEPSQAEARGHRGGGGMSSRPAGRPSGAKSRPASRPSSGGARPSTRPSAGARPSKGTRPSAGTRPSTRPAAKPSTRPAAKPASRPAAKPATRPAGGNKARPPGSRPPGARPPGSRPPGSRPPGAGRPPGSRPAGGRPPGYHPPHHRPPGYRPPYHRPPYYRPPHYRYGSYYYNSGWGWFFTAVLVSSTLVYVSDLPSDKECQKVQEDGETLYLCDGVLYRSTYYEDDKVYEIVSDSPEEEAAGPQTVFGLSLTDPMTRGDVVKELQQKLSDLGYDVGTPDGVFGSSTEAALQWFQYDSELEPTGIVDAETAKKLGYEQLAPNDAPSAEGTEGGAAQGGGDVTTGEDVGESATGEDVGEITTQEPADSTTEAPQD